MHVPMKRTLLLLSKLTKDTAMQNCSYKYVLQNARKHTALSYEVLYAKLPSVLCKATKCSMQKCSLATALCSYVMQC